MIVWQATGFYMVLFLAAMEGIPESYYEAAKLDGATGFQQFRHITLPLIREVLTVGVIFLMISSLKFFDAIWVMENQTPTRDSHVLATLLYQKVFTEYNVGYGGGGGGLPLCAGLLRDPGEPAPFPRGKDRILMRRAVQNSVIYLVLGLWLLAVVLPVGWVFVNSLRDSREFVTNPFGVPWLFSGGPGGNLRAEAWDHAKANYAKAWVESHFSALLREQRLGLPGLRLREFC